MADKPCIQYLCPSIFPFLFLVLDRGCQVCTENKLQPIHHDNKLKNDIKPNLSLIPYYCFAQHYFPHSFASSSMWSDNKKGGTLKFLYIHLFLCFHINQISVGPNSFQSASLFLFTNLIQIPCTDWRFTITSYPFINLIALQSGQTYFNK